jgi:hypothetical protein
VQLAGAFSLLLASLFVAGCKDQGVIEQPPAPPAPDQVGVLYDVAGTAGSSGTGGDGGPATEARLYWPVDVYVYDVTGDIYITDWNNHVYRKVSPDGIIDLAFGNNRHGDDFDGPVKEISLNHPGGCVVGPDGNFYLAVWHNWKIKVVDKNTQYATSVVGTDAGFSGDGGPGNLAQIFLPSGVVFDPTGNMYISDQGNLRIRVVNTQGTINTLAGRQTKGSRDGFGLLASFAFSQGNDAYPGGRVDIDALGENLYVADQENHLIRKINIATMDVSTVAGTVGVAGYSGDGGPAMQAQINYPCDVACAPNGDVYFADTRNNVVRKIDPAGNVSTVVGTGVAGSSPNATLATEAMLNYVTGIYFHGPSNTLYIADTYNSMIKKVKVAE